MDVSRLCTSIITREFPDVIGIWLFGSTVAKMNVAGSDVDLAVLCDGKLDRLRLWRCAQLMASKVGHDVDVIDLMSASTVLRAQILDSGQRIYCTDAIKCDTFETEALADYVRFSDERRELIYDIEARGKVYGDGR